MAQSERDERDSAKFAALSIDDTSVAPEFRQYRIRFYGLSVLILLNIACASRASLSTHFGLSTTQISWLANAVCAMYLAVAPFIPLLVGRFGLGGVIRLSGAALLVGTWLRYAAIAPSSSTGQFALLMVGSFFVGFGQCIAQIVVPLYSETWFNVNNRTTVTMLCAVSNPLGGAVASLVAPGVPMSTLLAAVAIASSAVSVYSFFVPQRPRTPPSASAESRAEYGFLESFTRLRLLRPRDALDLALLTIAFSSIMAFFDALLTLTDIIVEPVGYSSDQAGYLGAAIIGSGLVCAIITAPILDRALRNHRVFIVKLLAPVIGATFLALIWAVRPNDFGGLVAISVVMGGAAFTLLPIAIELAADLTFETGLSPDWSASVLYWGANGLSVVTVVGMTALQDGPPSNSMYRALLFQGIFVFASCLLAFGIRGKQYRKEMDDANWPERIAVEQSRQPLQVKTVDSS